MENYIKRDSCRLCKSNSVETVMDVGNTPVGDDFITGDNLDKVQDKYPLELMYCQDCSLLQLSTVINPITLYRDYIYETSKSIGLETHFKNCADKILKSIGPEPKSLIVDIGSNDGTLLKYFQNRDMRVLGVDPASHIAHNISISGIPTIAEFFNCELAMEIREEHGPAAIITANNVIANIDDLDNVMQGVSLLLKKNGVFIIETGYMLDMVQNTVIDNVYHEHLSYFSVKPLVKYFETKGFEITDIERIPTKGGSIRCTIQVAGRNRKISPTVSEFMMFETELGFDRAAPLKAFTSRCEHMKQQLGNILTDKKAQGKSVFGYGASVGVTTLIYYLGLKEGLQYLLDDNVTRHNLYSPGVHIPVIPSDNLYSKKPDFVLILAWRYATAIMKRHRNYLEKNGHFIIPLPIVEVI